jgi:hypothetical protein
MVYPSLQIISHPYLSPSGSKIENLGGIKRQDEAPKKALILLQGI